MRRLHLRTILVPLFTIATLVLPSCGGSQNPPGQSPPAPAPAPAAAPPESNPGLLAEGAKAPDFLASDQSGARRTLSEHRGRAVVLYFYPKDATPGCTVEACAFRDAWDRLTAAGATVLGVSADDVESHRRFAEEHTLPFPLLADDAHRIMRQYGVPVRDGRAARVTFVIDARGHVARVFPDVDPGVHAEEVLEALGGLDTDGTRVRVAQAVSAQDRQENDRALDAGRRPEATLAFFGIREGMRVAEIFAGTGYTTELLARVVGPEGQVFAHNNRFVLERFAEGPWSARLAKDVMKPVVRVDRELVAPFDPDTRDLDAVVFVLAYHDTVWMGADRAAMNRAVWNALRSGGVYGIVDHDAAAGHGVQDVKTLHRIERSVVVEEVTATGFDLADEALFLRNPQDAHDWNAAPSAAAERRGTSDRFVLLFRKP